MQQRIGTRVRTKKCKEGYSWWTLLFGAFVPLFRGMPFGYTFKLWVLAVFTFGISNIYYGFKINDDYIEYLEDEGYVAI